MIIYEEPAIIDITVTQNRVFEKNYQISSADALPCEIKVKPREFLTAPTTINGVTFTPVDISDVVSITGSIYRYPYGDDKRKGSLAAEFVVNIDDPENGIFTLTLSADQTGNISTPDDDDLFFYDVVFTDADQNVTSPFRGECKLIVNVT